MTLTTVIISSLLSFMLGSIIGFVLDEQRNVKAGKNAAKLLEKAEIEAEKRRKETLLETKQEIHNLKLDADKDIKERKKIVFEAEEKLLKREERFEQRVVNLDRRESVLSGKEDAYEKRNQELKERLEQVDILLDEQEKKLVEISGITREEAKDLIMDKVENDMALEIASFMKEEEENAKRLAGKKAQSILANAINQYAQDATSDNTVSVVTLPNDEMKGRIIGREGRNIRAIESLTGVDLIIDDTPEAVVLSGFDPIRREVAKKALETLVSDGRIHPGRIEEVIEKSRKEINAYIREIGEEAVYELGIGKIHPDLIKLIGRLKYRTSYGQNALKHSLETAFLAGKLAVELGENEILARRAGLLHDIGKAVDHEIEGSHVEIGIQLATKYKENKVVLDAISSHHGDSEAQSIIAVLVSAADTLSAARPGARSEAVDNYIKRLEQLEEISTKVEGVEKAYAIQAGREVRVIVKPDVIDDVSTYKVARTIKEQIEDNLTYPGNIKVTVIREMRATDVAK